MNAWLRQIPVLLLILAPGLLSAQQSEIEEVDGLPSLPGDFSFESGGLKKDLVPSLRFPARSFGNSGGSGGSLQPSGSHANWSASIEPSEVAPGDHGKVILTAQVDRSFHIYPYRVGEPENRFRTFIVPTQTSSLNFSEPRSQSKIHSQDLGGGSLLEYYEGTVIWELPFSVPSNCPLGLQEIELMVGFNTCNERTCDPPAGLKFAGSVNVVKQTGSAIVEMKGDEIDFQSVEQAKPQKTVQTVVADEPLKAWMILAAIAGGFILNFMPCVLPVVGLKLMSFVNQSGNNHRRVIALNLSFVAGIMVVVLMLAAFNIFTKLAGQTIGWGEQFNNLPLQIGIVILLFAMALSFLGVWEIPIPGFATSSKAGELLQKEGLSGAFYKGILTTLLATPCSGPLLGAVFGETLKLSAFGSLVVFSSVGIGLGLPYLAMCLWPNSIRLLPKPGPWMDTLKQVLAFPLLMSMVWFLNVIDPQYHIAVLVLLIVVWFACWLVGRVPPYAESHARFRVTATGIAICVVAGVISFKYFGPTKHLLPWQPYSEAVFEANLSEGKVVMIEFTARWCPTCQTNMRFAIDRPEVAKLVKQHEITTLLADWTDTSPNSANSNAIRRKVHELESNSIPLLAIYGSDRSSPPIVLRDMITQQQLIDALEKAAKGNTAGAKQVGALR